MCRKSNEIREQLLLSRGAIIVELTQLFATKSLSPSVIIDKTEKVPRLPNDALKWIQREGLIFLLNSFSAGKPPPLRRFLFIFAQNQGKLLNFQGFARDVVVDKRPFGGTSGGILEKTYLGVLLRPYHPSLWKSQLLSPKFYFFDCGVQRQLLA